MIPVEQRRRDDCFSAVVASLLERSLDEVAYFPTSEYKVHDWIDAWLGWLNEQGYAWYGGVIHPTWQPPEGYWILSAESPRLDGIHHSVVCHGPDIVWDPHPQREMGVGKWVSWYRIEKED